MLEYMDRWGKHHQLEENSKRRDRSGVFAVCIADDKILLSWPACAPDIPELPGGGIEQGEEMIDALVREVKEEADVDLDMQHRAPSKTQLVGFYAEYEKEFWDYTQTYFHLDERDAQQILFENETNPADALKAAWVPLKELSELKLHAVHAKALEEIMKGRI